MAKKSASKVTKQKAKKLNETGRRTKSDRRKKTEAREGAERRKVQRRRQIDPTTCERDYTDEEVEFMQALDQYKRDNGRMFPTCSEILEVIRDLGYQRVQPPAGQATDQSESTEADPSQPVDAAADQSADA